MERRMGEEREKEKERAKEKREKSEKERGSQHTSTSLQVMFVLEHLGQVWATLLQDTAYGTVMTILGGGRNGISDWRVFSLWADVKRALWLSDQYIWLQGNGFGWTDKRGVSVNR